MKKSLFLLFCIYFFVVQAIIIGIIWQESYMYLLALINLVAIILILVLHKAFGLNDEEPKTAKHAIKREEREVVTSHHETTHVKRTTVPAQGVKTILAVLFGIIIYVLLMGTGFGFKLVIASIIVLVIMFFVYLFSKSLRYFFKYIGTKILLAALVIGIVIFGYQFSFQIGEQPASLGQYIGQNFDNIAILGSHTPSTGDAYVLSGEGTVLGTGTETGQASTDILNLFSGTQDSDVITGDNEQTTTTPTTPTGKSMYMADMIKYLITTYTIPLVTTKDVKFTYVSYSNELYPYFRTAYAKALIGSSTNPTKLALCKSYITMKGMLENRNVSYTKTNVLTQFWNYAETNGKLNGCAWSAVLKDSNL